MCMHACINDWEDKHFPSKREAIDSTPNIAKREKVKVEDEAQWPGTRARV